MHAPYTRIMVFWHISNTTTHPPATNQGFHRVKFAIIPPCFIWQQYLWNIAKQATVGCSVLLICKTYDQERNRMFSKISTKYENICEIESRSTFKFILTSDNPLVMKALGKFIYTAFQKR